MYRDEVIATLRPLLPHLLAEYAVRELYLCGSVARGEERPDSDVDFTIVFEDGRTVTLSSLGRLLDFLSDTLGRQAEIGELSALRPSVRASMERDMIRVE